jgi:hypothetical protein
LFGKKLPGFRRVFSFRGYLRLHLALKSVQASPVLVIAEYCQAFFVGYIAIFDRQTCC